MSFIDKDYPIITLPRVNDLKLPERLTVSTVSSAQDSSINLGISKSNISTYLINPSPRLIWSYPISPSTIIEAIDNNEHFHIIGVTDRRHYKLLKLTSEGNEIDQEYKLSHKIKSIKIVQESIMIMMDNRDFKVLDADFNVIKEINEPNGGGNPCEVLFGGIDNGYGLMVLKTGDNQLKYKLINSAHGYKVSVHSEQYEECIFDFTQNHIYKFNKSTQEMIKMNLGFKVENITSLVNILNNEKQQQQQHQQQQNEDAYNEISLVVPSEDRVIICNNSLLQLINLKYQTILDQFQLDSNSSHCLLKTVKVKGNSLSSLNTIVLYLKLNLRKNKLTLNLINVNIGPNNLLANLGKGFNNSNDNNNNNNKPSNIIELTDLLEDDYENKPNEFFNKAKQLYQGKHKRDKDLYSFEVETMKYFKGNHINLEDDKHQNDDGKKSLGYYQYEITDKNIDVTFMNEFLKLILTKDHQDNVQFVNKDKVPKRVLNYLLTHKLYPQTYSKGLIKLLSGSGSGSGSGYPKLLKTCVINCPNLELLELIDLLTNSNDLKFIAQVINKLNEFNLNDLIDNLKFKLSSVDKVTINQLINKLITINNFNSWFFIKLIVDINGIINLNLTQDKIDKLIKLVNEKLALLDLNSFNLNLINEKLMVHLDHVPNYSFEKLQI